MKLCVFIVAAILIAGSVEAYVVSFQNNQVNQTKYLDIIGKIDEVKDIDNAGVKKIIIRDYLYWNFMGESICGFAWYHTGIFTINDKAYREGLCGSVTPLDFDIAHEVCHHDMIKNVKTCNEGDRLCNEEYADKCAAEIWLLMDEGDTYERPSETDLRGALQESWSGLQVSQLQGLPLVSEVFMDYKTGKGFQELACISS